MAKTVGQRVDRLEEALMKLAYAQFNNEMGLKELREENLKFQREMVVFKDEMRAFKNEMLDFKDEMRAFKNEMTEFKNEMLDFKDEMRAFKNEMAGFKNEMLDFKNGTVEFRNEMLDFKNEMAEFKRKVDEDIAEMKRERREMNLQWGAIANKLGTIVEDIIYPSCRRIAREHFGAPDELEFEGQRIRRPRKRGDRREFDGILVWEGHVMLLEAKATVRPEYLEAFDRFVREEAFFRYFPEYAGRRLIPIFSSLSLTEDEVAWLTERRLYAVAMGEEAMALLNPDCPLDRADAR
ncbi:hypothetical protein [Sulfuricystis thermophila]|uniref:hypothetical protein n=1 Tax=Sulfuricystis thermophila TaxID=2496847 RepID=UPI001035B976|nr:hypothetical protein [Sulfuricystis thermophila]